jgi:hypothetical protein
MAIAVVCTDSGKTLLSPHCTIHSHSSLQSGNTDAHCGAGCQSGNCLNAPVVAAPGPKPAPAAPNGGSFNVVGDSGVPAMHAALMPNGQVMFLDK